MHLVFLTPLLDVLIDLLVLYTKASQAFHLIFYKDLFQEALRQFNEHGFRVPPGTLYK